MSETPQPKRTFHDFASLFWHRVEQSPNLEAFRYPVEGGSWRSYTWKQFGERVSEVAGGLLALGLEMEQRVSIVCSTRVEWIEADLGIMCAGGATTTVYPSNKADECSYIIADSGSRVVFAEDDGQIAKLKEHKDDLKDVIKVVTFDGTPDGDWIISLDDLKELGREHLAKNENAMKEIADALEPESLATLIYTSGTTGRPKGVRLVHDSWVYVGEATNSLGFLGPDDLTLLWLPLSHSMAKAMMAIQIAVGLPAAIDGDIPRLVDNLATVKPTWTAAAPRIFEKAYNKIIAGAKAGGGMKYKIFKWAMDVGLQASKIRRQGREPSGMLGLKLKIADKMVHSKIRARFGGRISFFISGSAPLAVDIAEFFHATGMLILEGYGLTESSAASFVNRPESYAFGTVGIPLPGTSLKLAEEDNEIMIKGPGIMRGYHNLPEVTARTLTDDGWLLTGDIGETDEQGFLKITDRKKDLIKTSGGKYVAPQRLEGRFKTVCPVASQIIVHGDRRNYCTALITLDEEAITAWANTNGLAGKTYEELTKNDQVRALVQSYIDQMNQKLASYETLKKFEILPKDLTIEDGELTPSLKVKRKHVEKKYMDLLDGMYKDAMQSM